MTIILREDQIRALKEEAYRRALNDGGRPDASAIVREILDAWIVARAAKQGKK